MGVRKVAVSAGMAFALAAAFGLAGCGSGQHEVIDQGQDCSSCHSGGKQVFDDAVPEQISSVKTEDGSAQVQLSEGTWAFCAQVQGSVKAQLVTVSSESTGAADVEL